MNKKPLYRPLNKVTHNGPPHHDYGFKNRYRFDRNSKQNVNDEREFAEKSSIQKRWKHKNTDIGLFDYTPLYKFLLKKEGCDWGDVWKECQERLNTTAPVFNMVVNINHNGLPTTNMEDSYWNGAHYTQEFKEKHYREINGVWYPKAFSISGFSYFSTMFVDEEGKLQIVDKDYIPFQWYPGNCNWTETLNGVKINDIVNGKDNSEQ